MASRQLRLPIKSITFGGQLGSGKTSLILRLIATKPKDEVWAVLVNEAGAVGIDQALLSGAESRKPTGNDNATAPTVGGVKIKMLGGGCLCCTLSSVTSAALVQLIRNSKPDRLIIEPSGLAHPKALLEMLQGPHLASALDLQPIVCLVDLCTFNPLEDFDEEGSSFMAQVALADVLIGTKADICGQQQQDAFITWALALQPRPVKILISTTSEMNSKDLDVVLEKAKAKLAAAVGKNVKEKKDQTEEDQISTLFSDGLFLDEQSISKSRLAGERKKVWLTNSPSCETSMGESNIPRRGHPVRKELVSALGGTSTCGWIFCKEDVFNPIDLEKFAADALPHIFRLKGIFRIEEDKWVLISIGSSQQKVHSKSTTTVQGSDRGDSGIFLQALDGTYQDSRVEIIVEKEAGNSLDTQSELVEALKSKDWNRLESLLLQVLVLPQS